MSTRQYAECLFIAIRYICLSVNTLRNSHTLFNTRSRFLYEKTVKDSLELFDKDGAKFTRGHITLNKCQTVQNKSYNEKTVSAQTQASTGK